MMEIRLAHKTDIDGWMMLVEQVRDAFPGLETAEAMAEHRATVLNFIQNLSLIHICIRVNGRGDSLLL